MRNILAENMLRFSVKNLNESDKQILNRLIEQEKTSSTSEIPTVTIPYKQLYSLKPGDSKPDSYIGQMHKGILNAINSDATAKAMFDSKSIKLVAAVFNGGASNVWGGKATGFDAELNGTKVTPTETELYQKNHDLAVKRADECKTALFGLLQNDGIKIATVNPPKINAYVYNTGGKLSNQAQIIDVKLYFRYLDSSDIKKPEDILPTFIQIGSYKTVNGQSATKQVYTDTKAWQESVAKLTPEQKKDPNRLLAFEVKWNANNIKDAYKTPWYRWVFYYGTDGKIEKIDGKCYDTNLNASLGSYFKDNNNVPKNDPSLQQILKISGYASVLAPYM